LATTRRRFPPGAILSGSSEKTHATPRASAGPDLASRSRCQWLPHRIVDHEASGGSDSKDLPHALPFQHRWPTPASPRVDAPEARRTCFGAEQKGHRALEAERLAPGKKNAARLGAHLVFADESGFLLAPLVVKTWAPRGCTPLHRHRQGRRDKISVLSGISLSPKRHRKRSVCFCVSYCGSYAAPSLFSWITPPPIRENRSRSSSVNTRVSESSIFRPTPRNSTPMKEFGLWPSENSPIAAPRTSMN